jgi:hypothetical protein
MQPIDTLYNKLEKIGSEISHLFNDGKEHDIIIKVTPEEAKQISKGINLHIIQKISLSWVSDLMTMNI